MKGRLNLGSPRSYLRGVGSNAVFMEMTKYYRKRVRRAKGVAVGGSGRSTHADTHTHTVTLTHAVPRCPPPGPPQIRILEVDRDRAIKSHDRVKAHNEEVRREINVLRKNAILQHKQFDQQREKLLEVRDLMAKDLKAANDILELNEECKESIELLQEDDAQEQEDFERECAALSQYVSERLERLGACRRPARRVPSCRCCGAVGLWGIHAMGGRSCLPWLRSLELAWHHATPLTDPLALTAPRSLHRAG